MKKMIFHHPLPLQKNAKSASGIRPIKMLNSFRRLGYDVEIIAGFSAERKNKVSIVKKSIKTGVKYDFVYSESSTLPTALTDSHHLPVRPFFDFSFFRFCKNNNIPVGLFYRDIYWRFNDYGEALSLPQKIGGKIMYWWDLLNYDQFVDQLYLPSQEMVNYIPLICKKKIIPLPPGHDVKGRGKKKKYGNIDTFDFNIFYVGGFSDHYQMHKLFKVINERKDIQLTICTRKEEWLKYKEDYPQTTENIKIIHKRGADMIYYLEKADIVSLFVKPKEYWGFASPVKLYEYLGYEKPIIASRGTLAGDFVASNDIGWTIPYSTNDLNVLLDKLISNSSMVYLKRKNMRAVAEKHTWLNRAQKVIQNITNLR